MTNDITVRFATAQDSNELSRVIAEVINNISYYNELAKKTETEKFSKDELTAKILDDNLSVIVVTISEKIVGFCMSRFDDYTIWLEWFGILNEHRGKGISNLLIKKLEETISIRKCHKIWCDCRTGNNASIYILTSAGFNQITTLKNHWYNQDFILWEKFIKS